MILTRWVILIVLAVGGVARGQEWSAIEERYFQPPAEWAGKLGDYRPVLKDGEDWGKKRAQILDDWQRAMGKWPAVLERPKLELVREETRDAITWRRVRVEIAAGELIEGWLLVPAAHDSPGKRPAVVIVFYEPESSVGLGKNPQLAYGLELAKRGFVTLSIGSPPGGAWKPRVGTPGLQPLSYLGYVAANCQVAMSQMPEVDPSRIGIIGHSYGGKWAMVAACLWDKFAAGVWSDPGVVFDEKRPNVNYWEPWYLGFDPAVTHKPGLVTRDNPRTGAYKQLIEEGHNLHELQCLMAPRPMLVSGGSEDGVERWAALNHVVAVNRRLGKDHRVGLTTRAGHSPTEATNEIVYRFFEHFLATDQMEGH